MEIDQSLHEMPDQSRKVIGVIFFSNERKRLKSQRVILQFQQRPMAAAVEKKKKKSCRGTSHLVNFGLIKDTHKFDNRDIRCVKSVTSSVPSGWLNLHSTAVPE